MYLFSRKVPFRVCNHWTSVGRHPALSSPPSTPNTVSILYRALTPMSCEAYPTTNAMQLCHCTFMSYHMYEDLYMDTLYRTLHRVPWTLMSNAHKSPYTHKCQYSCSNTNIYHIRVNTSNKHASTPFRPLLRQAMSYFIPLG